MGNCLSIQIESDLCSEVANPVSGSLPSENVMKNQQQPDSISTQLNPGSALASLGQVSDRGFGGSLKPTSEEATPESNTITLENLC